MALASTMLSDFSGGIYRGRSAPSNTVYEALNCLLNDEGFLFRRGGSAYLSTSNAGSTLLNVVAPYFVGPGATRVLAWSGTDLYTLDGAGAPVTLRTSLTATLGTPALVGGMAIFPVVATDQSSLLYYGGSRKSANYSTGTASFTTGSATITGAGTSWLANVDAGMLFSRNTIETGIVASIDSDTQITLTQPWAGGTAAGVAYTSNRTILTAYSALPRPLTPKLRAVAGGSGVPRLVFVINNRAYLADVGNPFIFDVDIYHELPLGAEVTGAMPDGDNVVLFSSAGVWRIGGLSLAPVDDFGNQQQTVSLVSSNMTLWGDRGLASYDNSFVVPALDDIYVLTPGGSATCISESIRSLFRSYVKAGYQPGRSTVFRGHYFMTVLDAAGTTTIDTLVCRLDRPYKSKSGRTLWPWTRWSGHAAGSGFAAQIGGTAAPSLVGINAQRVTDLSSTFDSTSSNAQDADATNFDCTIITRDLPTGQQPGFVQRARLRYELTDDGSGATAAPTVALAYSSDADAGSFSTLTDKGLQAGGTGGAVSAGDKYNWWTVTKRRDRIRFRIVQTGAAASFVLRSLEMLVRPSGKQ